MKPVFYLVIAALVLSSLACSVTINAPTIQTGDTQTLTINETAPDAKLPAAVNLSMGAGTLTLTGGATNLVEGTVRYNISGWKPSITRDAGNLTIAQDTKRINVIPGNKPVNDWVLKLGKTPMALSLKAGAYEGKLDLSGVALTSLDITDGASTSKVIFNSLNPQVMSTFSYRTGASTVELNGLANANFRNMTFDGGAGSYTLDFSGVLQSNANVKIKGGVSDMTIRVPAGTNCTITVTGGLNTVSTSGTWNSEGKVYTNSGTSGAPRLTIDVEMGVGTLHLESR
jgi:hypothetical protein